MLKMVYSVTTGMNSFASKSKKRNILSRAYKISRYSVNKIDDPNEAEYMITVERVKGKTHVGSTEINEEEMNKKLAAVSAAAAQKAAKYEDSIASKVVSEIKTTQIEVDELAAISAAAAKKAAQLEALIDSNKMFQAIESAEESAASQIQAAIKTVKKADEEDKFKAQLAAISAAAAKKAADLEAHMKSSY